MINSKSSSLGYHVSQCPDCGHMEFHSNSCRNRNCPNCQAVNKEIWVDKRRAEVIEYLGKYTHKIAISNRRILSVTGEQVTFSARGRKPGDPRRTITLQNTEFIRRYLMHVLPAGFQKIRYYGFLTNRYKSKNLRLIFTLQGHQRFKARYTGLSLSELLKTVWNVDISLCPVCGCCNMRPLGRIHAPS